MRTVKRSPKLTFQIAPSTPHRAEEPLREPGQITARPWHPRRDQSLPECRDVLLQQGTQVGQKLLKLAVGPLSEPDLILCR